MLACPTRSTRTYTLFPSTTLFRADPGAGVRGQLRHRVAGAARPARQPARQWLVIDSHLRLKALLGTATIVVLGLVAFAIGGLRIFERTYPLEVVLEDAAGLEAGDPVRVAGVAVGSVTGVERIPEAATLRVPFQVD